MFMQIVSLINSARKPQDTADPCVAAISLAKQQHEVAVARTRKVICDIIHEGKCDCFHGDAQ